MDLPKSFPSSIPYPSQITRSKLKRLDVSETVTSIRLHPIKNRVLDQIDIQEEVAWCPNGYYLSSRPSFTLDPSFHSGAYYMQDAGSMLLRWVLDQCQITTKENISVLDLCGAPGGKSTLIAEWLHGDGVLVANEVIQARSTILAKNIAKSGYSNVMVTQLDPKELGQINSSFDIIVVDAPCSGEGMWRKDPKAIQEWSPEHVQLCSARQDRILNDIMPALANGGYLIYATCAYNEIENIGQVNRLQKEHSIDSIPLSPPSEWNLLNIKNQGAYGLQSLPGETRGEGLFISLLQKKSNKEQGAKIKFKTNFLNGKQKNLLSPFINKEALEFPYILTKSDILYLIPERLMEFYYSISKKGKVIRTGLLAGKLSQNLFIPSQELALSLHINHKHPAHELDLDEAVLFLKKELTSIKNAQKGWILIRYKSNALAWAKNLGKRINNYLPKGDIIRKR